MDFEGRHRVLLVEDFRPETEERGGVSARRGVAVIGVWGVFASGRGGALATPGCETVDDGKPVGRVIITRMLKAASQTPGSERLRVMVPSWRT